MMGKFKVSFTTALFVFSFVICVIVAVVFVDRAPRNEYDNFYEKDAAAQPDRAPDRSNTSGWDPSSPAPATAAAPIATAAVPRDESTFADLPIDPHLAGMAQPVHSPPAATPAVNPMAGRSPEDIARALAGQAGINAQAQAASSIPGMAVPDGIATPMTGQSAMPTQTPRATGPSYLPMQSNAPGLPSGSAGGLTNSGGFGTGIGAAPNLGGVTNSTGWNQIVTPKATPQSMIGVQGIPTDPNAGMMISSGRSQPNAPAPAGLNMSPTQSAPETLPSLQGGQSNQHLISPPPPGAENWDVPLPPAPTLPPPAILDPDRPRSDAGDTVEQTLDSLVSETSETQAVAVSEIEPETPQTQPDPEAIARVQDRELHKDEALKLVEVRFDLLDETPTDSKRKDALSAIAQEWTNITAAAELAKKQGLDVGAPEVEQYASMRPDFDPAAWQKSMARHGFSKTQIRDYLMDIALSEKLVESQFYEEFTEEKMREAYDRTPSKYNTPRLVHVMEIYKKKPDSEDRVKKVEAELKRLQRQAASGTDFSFLARQTSEAPSKSQGGDLGWINPKAEPDAERDNAIADLEPGQVSEIIEEASGYRLYKLVDVKEATSDFEGGKELLIADLKSPVREKCFEESLEKLEADAPSQSVIEQAIASAKAQDEAKTSGKSVATDSADQSEDAKAEARRKKAQEVLAANREPKQVQVTHYSNPSATSDNQQVVMNQPGLQNQLLYAPGTQVQQMGGQPAPANQAGGQTPAPVQSTMVTTPQYSIDYTPGAAVQGNAPANTQVMGDPSTMDYADMTAAFASQPAPTRRAAPNEPEVTQSNGWTVTKTVRDENAERAMTAQRQAEQQQASYNEEPSNVPGFGGSAGSETRNESGGIIGGVKSFFGRITR